ncbi:MAG TPA: hypothetical protein VMS17_23655 [Gemmataceae bacterium]|nr:hypothetical protein [Gemmataceae bacterium]
MQDLRVVFDRINPPGENRAEREWGLFSGASGASGSGETRYWNKEQANNLHDLSFGGLPPAPDQRWLVASALE